MLIVIDPGHGGGDPGAVGFGLKEKNLTLKLSSLLMERLRNYQVEVIPTRDSDVNAGLSARANLANNLNADFFYSLHINAGGGTGFESYIHPGAKENTRHLRSIIHGEAARYYVSRGFADRGEKQADFAVLRETKMPAVLLENLFLDNPRDAACLADSQFLNGLADALTTGLVRALDLKLKTQWDPAQEISRLKERGLIVDDHSPDALVTWGELATVLNRLLDKEGL